MRNYYIKPATLIVSQITDAVFMEASDDGNPNAAKHQLNFGDTWEESSDNSDKNSGNEKGKMWDD